MQFEQGKQPKGSTPFLPGKSGNPNGRPKGPITQFLREFGNANEILFSIEITKVNPKGTVETSKSSSSLSTGGMTINQAIAARLLQMAMNGDIKAIREVLNRTEGRVPLPISFGNGVDNGSELKAWTAEDVDKYEDWQQQTRQEAESVEFEEIDDNEDTENED